MVKVTSTHMHMYIAMHTDTQKVTGTLPAHKHTHMLVVLLVLFGVVLVVLIG